ncbi:MAG TPA: hypothetical protein VGI06_12480, partial [Acidimicrobiales bacterium]
MARGDAGWYRPSPSEVAWGWVPGWTAPDADPGAPARSDPRAALEAAILDGLRRPPCIVAFSGGRDSSAVLAVAVDAARRHGLAPPVPLTHVFR